MEMGDGLLLVTPEEEEIQLQRQLMGFHGQAAVPLYLQLDKM